MGCTGSQSADVVDEAEEQKRRDRASAQRRRLSVAPEQVGDISTPHAQQEAPPEQKVSVMAGNQGCVYAVVSQQGFVPYNRNKVNQDRPVVKQGLGGNDDLQLYGVMDGHGEFGHLVAQFVSDKLPGYLEQQPDLLDNTSESLDRAVCSLCQELDQSGIVTSFSGTTCVFSLLIRDKETGKRFMHVANIGDSRCVLAVQEGGSLVTKDLSFDHKPDNPKEKERILAAGGRVETLPGPPGEDTGPYRVWLAKADVPGLAMSRSIGDQVSHTVGVIHNPEVHKYEITDQAQFAIWASDGVWEFIASDEAVALVAKVIAKSKREDLKGKLTEACEALYKESNKRWREQEEVIDDITCLIVSFT